MNRLTRPLAAVALALPTAGFAASAVLDGRESRTYISFLGGFAIAGDSGTDGSLTLVTALQPPTLGIANSNHYVGAYLGWDVTFDTAWALTQTWAVDPLARTISGSGRTYVEVSGLLTGPNCPCLPTMQNEGQNLQGLMFTLDAATPYSFVSHATGEQFLELQQWFDAGQRWVGLWSGPIAARDTTFTSSGTLAAGRWRVVNNGSRLRANHVVQVNENVWDFTLTLPNATVSAVPEPAPVALLAAGIAVMAWRARRRIA